MRGFLWLFPIHPSTFHLSKMLNHVEDPARCARNNLHACFEGVDVIGDTLASDAHVHLNVQVVTSIGKWCLKE